MILWIDLEPSHTTFNNVGANRLDFTDFLFSLSPQQLGGRETSNISQILTLCQIVFFELISCCCPCLSLTNLYDRITVNGSAICPWLCSASILPGFHMPDPLILLCVFSFCQSSLSATTVRSTALLCPRSRDSNCEQEAELCDYSPVCLGCYRPFC